MVWGAILAGAGIAANAYGEHQGTSALMHAKRREIQDSEQFDAQRNSKLGVYLQHLEQGGPGASENAAATDEAMLANRSFAANGSGASALGVQAKSPITAGRRVQMRANGTRRRMMGSNLHEETLDSELGDIERQRRMTAATYPGIEADAAEKGKEWRQLGSLLGAGGQAVNSYEQMSQYDPDGYSNRPEATNRPQGPSRYKK